MVWGVVGVVSESCTNTSVIRLYFLVQTSWSHFPVCSEEGARVGGGWGGSGGRGVVFFGVVVGGQGCGGCSVRPPSRPGLSWRTQPCGGQQQFLRMIPGGKQVKPSHERGGLATPTPLPSPPPHGKRGGWVRGLTKLHSLLASVKYWWSSKEKQLFATHTTTHPGPKSGRFAVWLRLLCTAQSLSLSCTAKRHLKVVPASCCRRPSLFCLCRWGGVWSHWGESGHAWRGG